MKTSAFGTCLFDKEALRRLSRLWEGGVTHGDLHHIERALRAFMVYDSLSVMPFNDVWSNAIKANGAFVEHALWSDEIRHPFDEQEDLNWEFRDFSFGDAVPDLVGEERGFLERFVEGELRRELKAILPEQPCSMGQLYRFVDQWYKGDNVQEAMEALATHNREGAHDDDGWPPSEVAGDEQERMELEYYRPRTFLQAPKLDDLKVHAVRSAAPVEHARFLVELHSQGYGLCSSSVIARIATDHIFAKWPAYFFSHLSVEFEKEARSLLAPGYAVPLPPILSVVLSEARNRAAIPGTMIELRNEFKKAREQLWSLLHALWLAPSMRAQLEIHRQLEGAAQSIYPAAFPKRFDALAVSYGLVARPKSALKELLSEDNPNRQVRAVSFAHVLAKHLKNVLNQAVLFKRHFSVRELRELGVR